MGILTNASKSTIGLFDKNALRIILAINQSREFNYDHWYKIEKERERRVKKKVEDLLKDKSVFDLVKMVGKEAFNESRKWVDEVKEEYDEAFKLPILEHGAFEYLFKFNKTEDIDKWHITTDSSYKIGKSTASLTLTQNNTALFTGFISPEYDKPERTKAIYTGFANMSSVTRFKSFKRETRLDLKQYTHFLVRARGDGRSYMLVLNTPDYHTLTFTYMHSYPLFTRGGPYWQLAKIPFSKFFHVTHSRVSDRQFRFVPDRVKNIGVTCMDGVPGPFHLELDFIGVVKDNEFKEDIAYETYRIPKYVANT